MNWLTRQVRTLSNKLFGPAAPDAHIISYPKSGRTWLRMLIGRTICQKYGIDQGYILDTLKLTSIAGCTATKFSHDHSSMRVGLRFDSMPTNKDDFRPTKVIFLVRDPRDVMVSCFFQATKRINVYDGNISDFLRHECYGAKKLVAFSTIWWDARDVPAEFLLVRYEDLSTDTVATLHKTLAFLGVPNAGDRLIREAVDFARFDNMRKMEERGHMKRQSVTPGNHKDTESFKARRGKVGGYMDYLSPSDCDYVNSVIKTAACPMLDGYLKPAATTKAA